jgi:hypothetical protein
VVELPKDMAVQGGIPFITEKENIIVARELNALIQEMLIKDRGVVRAFEIARDKLRLVCRHTDKARIGAGQTDYTAGGRKVTKLGHNCHVEGGASGNDPKERPHEKSVYGRHVQ